MRQIELHEGQMGMLASRARTTVVTAGQGGGKTTGGYYWLLANMRAWPGESHLVGFPDYGLLTRVIINQPDPERQTLVQFLADMGEHPRIHVQERRIEGTNGQIFFASGEDLVGWEGAHVKTAWLDEFDEMILAVYRRAMERTRMRLGLVLLTGTPRNVKWIGEELKPLWERGDPSVKRIQFSSTMNPSYPPAAMEEARRTLPAWQFQRIYLGELAPPEGGGVFRREWWSWTEDSRLKEMEEIIQAWDTAYKKGSLNDYSACITVGRQGNHLYILDVWRGKVEFPELCRMATNLFAKWQANRVLVEDTASGQSLIQELRRNTMLPIMAIKVDRDKLSRATAVSGLVESGRVYLPRIAGWVHDFMEELAAFPDGSWHDDQVDAAVIALGWFAKRTGKVGLHV